MKQSNIDYRNTYHFSHSNPYKSEKTPSLRDDQPEVTTKILPNSEKQNVEIEKDEIVLKPDFTALHKAGGKRHSKGGTPVFLQPNSFVFSDDKTLALTKDDLELFELEGSKKVKDNTPAKVLEKNLDIKHYNTLTAILDDPKKDELAKKSAARMLEKYFGLIGNVAYIQEEKKGFPQGMPEFSEGSAPVYNTAVKESIMENKQYMKYGGSVSNPYLVKMQRAGYTPNVPLTPVSQQQVNAAILPPWMKDYDPNNKFNPHYGDKQNTFKSKHGVSNASKYTAAELQAKAKEVGYTGPLDNLSFQKWIWENPERRQLAEQAISKYNLPNAGKFDDGIWGIRGDIALEALPKKGGCPAGHFWNSLTNTCEPMPSKPVEDKPAETIETGEVDGPAQNGIQMNWKFTPWQKQSQLYNGAKWAMVDREMPMRSQYKATYMNPYLVNPEQAVGDMKGMANMAMTSANNLNPILANAQKAAAYGQLLNQVPGIRSQYDNQNATIVNQTRQYNNQIKNDETLKNLAFDQQYWKESVLGRQNFKNMRNFAADNFMNNRMRDVETNQKLAYQLATLGPNPAYGYDWDTGNFIRNEKNILDVQSGMTKGDDIESYAKMLIDTYKIDPTEAFKIATGAGKVKAVGNLTRNPFMKQGGKVKNPYKK